MSLVTCHMSISLDGADVDIAGGASAVRQAFAAPYATHLRYRLGS